MNKTLEIPYLPSLDAMTDGAKIAQYLDLYGAKATVDSCNWPAEFPYVPVTTATVGWTAQALYIDFFTRCRDLRAVNTANHSPVAQDSCVEVFLQPNPTGEYWNFEFNCIGTVNASHRIEKPSPTRLGDEEVARIHRYRSVGNVPFEEKEGLFAWNLTVVIPFGLVDVQPADGTVIKGNFYKCASATKSPHYISWAPIRSERPNFHLPEFFGDLILRGGE